MLQLVQGQTTSTGESVDMLFSKRVFFSASKHWACGDLLEGNKVSGLCQTNCFEGPFRPGNDLIINDLLCLLSRG